MLYCDKLPQGARGFLREKLLFFMSYYYNSLLNVTVVCLLACLIDCTVCKGGLG